MPKCFLCGTESAGPTCPACSQGAPGTQAPPRRGLSDLLARRRGAGPLDTTDDATGFEADTAEVATPERPAPHLGPEDRLDDVDEDTLAPRADVPVLLEALGFDDDLAGVEDATTADIDPETLEPILARGSAVRPSLPPAPPLAGPELPPADEDAPEHKKVERWNQVLNASPVFAGQGDFEVKTPSAPEPGSLEIAIATRFEFASAPTDAEPVVHMLVSVAPHGAPLMANQQGPVAHLILALDLSASMDTPEKYPVLGRALAGMFRELRSKWAHEVLVSVVAFAYGSETLLRAVPSSQLDEKDVLARLDAWDKRFTRYTDVVGALHRAGRLARDSVLAHRAMPVRIYVLTDGRPQDMPGAREVMTRIAKLPVDVHGLAFGDDADVDALTDLISGSRGGTVKHIRIDTIGEAFGRIGEVAQLVVANRSLLDVELRPGVIGGDAYRYRPGRHRFPKGSFAKGSHFRTDLGTLESGRTYSLVFQLRLRRTKRTETEVGRITLRIPGYGGPRTFERLVQLPRHPGAETGERDPEVQAALDVVSAIAGNDAAATLKALRARRVLYAQERRDAHVLFVIDKAIQELERHGNLLGLTASEHATLVSHTLTTRVRREPAAAATSAAAVSADIARALATLDDAGPPRG